MAKLERFPSMTLEYEWKFNKVCQGESFILSKKLVYQNAELFRVGVKKPTSVRSMPFYLENSPPVLFFLTTDLKKMGLKVATVTLTSQNEQFKCIKDVYDMKEVDLKTNENEENEAGAIQLFTVPLKGKFEFGRSSPEYTFIFKVYLTGIVNNYRVHLMDGLLNQQLWSSAMNYHDDSDFKLIAEGGKCFPVHKWLLAARSPVFAALFSDELIELNQYSLNCSEDRMNQLIKFIYTGELDGLIGPELMQLAARYQIKTLEYLCQIALQEVSLDKMAQIGLALHLEYERKNTRFTEDENEELDADFAIVQHEQDVSLFTCSWKVDLWKKRKQKVIKMSIPFEYDGTKVFRAEFEMIKRSHNEQVFKLKFLSYGHYKKIGCNINDVTCSVVQDDSLMIHHIEMNRKGTHNYKILEQFIVVIETRFANPFSHQILFTFRVRLKSCFKNSIITLVESTYSEQLWAAAVNGKMTDVEFLVGDESFGAHRSLLSARSPIFAAMFASGMKEAETGKVRIEDIDSETFLKLLHFLYTGTLEISSMDKDLFRMADKYQVETLIKQENPFSLIDEQLNDTYSIIKTFTSC